MKLKLDTLLENIPLNFPEPANISSRSKAAESNNFNIIAQLNQTEVIRKEIHLQKSVQDSTSTFALRGDTQSIGL